MSLIRQLIQLINREIPTKTLVKRGMKVGKNFNRQQGCFIDPTHCWLITIGDDVTFSIRVTVLAHDASMKKRIGYTRIRKVKIGNNVFVGANSTILPGVTIGDNSIIGSNSVVTKDIPADVVAAGNPTRVICALSEWDEKIRNEYLNSPHYEEEFKQGKITDIMKSKMINEINNKSGFIK